MNLLDNSPLMKELGKSLQFEWIQQWVKMLNDSIESGSNLELPQTVKLDNNDFVLDYTQDFTSIIICGMGGSAISGDYLASVLFHEEKFNIPIQIVRGYNLPNWVTSKTLVIGVSYSGNTRETLTCIYQALKIKSPIILLSSGGVVKEVAEKYSIPWISLPQGFQPRAAFPIIFGSILGLFDSLFPKIGIKSQLKNIRDIINETLNKNNPEVKIEENLAKKLALTLKNKIPVIISSESSLAMRWKGQFNENAKMVAFYEVFPEMMHNSIQGWENEQIESLEFVVLRLGNESSEITDKNRFCLNIANEKFEKKANLYEFNFPFLVENLIAATLFGDMVSIYLAALQSLDPSAIRLIVEMKKEFESKLNQDFDIKAELLKF
jgi:glucose/mannose-6-phosphate isomerase